MVYKIVRNQSGEYEMRMQDESGKIVTIGADQFFTADWLMEQMSAQGSSISRANIIAACAVVISLLSLIVSIAL